MRYRLSREAAQDLMGIAEYGIETFGPDQAQKYHHSLERIFGLLADMSGIGRSVPELGTDLRRFEHGRHSIFYVAGNDSVLIVRVIDSRRDMKRQFGIDEDGE